MLLPKRRGWRLMLFVLAIWLCVAVETALGAVKPANRVAYFAPSASDLQQTANRGQPSGYFPTALRTITLVFRHSHVFATGITALITDANRQPVPFEPAVINFYERAAASANATTNSTEVPDAWFAGLSAAADASGVVNFTSVKLVTCKAAVASWYFVVCPSPSVTATAVVCSERVNVDVYPDPSLIQLRFEGLGAYANDSAPYAVAGSAVRPFRIVVLSSCGTPLILPATVSGLNGSTLLTGVITVDGVGIVGSIVQPMSSDTSQSYAIFEQLGAVILPGAQRVPFDVAPPVSTTTLNVSIVFTALVPSPASQASTSISATVAPGVIVSYNAVLSAWTELEATVAPGQSNRTIPVATSVVSLSWEQFSLARVLDMEHRATGDVPQTTDALFSDASLAAATLSDETSTIDEHYIRDVGPGTAFAFVYSASAFSDVSQLNRVKLPEGGWSRAANSTLFCKGQYDVDQVPRGMAYGLTQSNFITPLLPFGITSTSANGTKSQRFVFAFLLGPLRSLASTLQEVLTCQPSTGLLALGYDPDPVQLELTVIGLPDTKTGTARRFMSVVAFLNPELAYISTIVQVCDCTLDHGLPMDLGLHPLQFGIGTDQLTRYMKGALLGNSLVIFFAFAVPYLVGLRLRAAAEEYPGRKKQLLSIADHTFPHLGIVSALALFPGITFAAYSLLPFVLSSFVLLAWSLIGVLWPVLFGGLVLRASVKLAPAFRDLDVHAITRHWIYKVVVPLGDYEGTHADMIRFRSTFMYFRGDYKWFHSVLLAQQLLTSIFAAHFIECRWRFLVPLSTQTIMFFFVVARAPYITAYRNVASVLSSVLIIIGLSILFWSGSERVSTLVISSWSMTLTGISIALTILDSVYRYFEDRYTIGAARGQLEEEFVFVSEAEESRNRRRRRYDATGMLHFDDDGEGDEFVDAEKVAQGAADDGLVLKVVTIDNDDIREANPFAKPVAVPNPYQREELRRREIAHQMLVDDILGDNTDEGRRNRKRGTSEVFVLGNRARGTTVAATVADSEFADWTDKLSPREHFEAEADAAHMRKEERLGMTIPRPFEDKRVRPRDTLNNPKAAERSRAERELLQADTAALERARIQQEEAEIDARFRRRSKPTAEPTLLYGRQFAPKRTFGYQKRAARLAAEEVRRHGGIEDPNEADDGLDGGEIAVQFVDRTEDEERRHRELLTGVMRTPALPKRNLTPAMEALFQRRREEREQREADAAAALVAAEAYAKAREATRRGAPVKPQRRAPGGNNTGLSLLEEFEADTL